MTKKFGILCALLLLTGCSILGAGTTYKANPQVVFDLGPLPSAPRDIALPALSVAEPNVPPWLDSFEMYYRLNYANDHQLRPYTNSRWSMPPLQLFSQRLKSSIAASGGQVLSSSENANNVTRVLHIDADDFNQVFDSPERSHCQIALRLSLFDRRNLVAQKTFSSQTAAPGSDAAGGARALSNASDALIGDILQWLSALNLKK